MIKTTFINSTVAQYTDKDISFAQDVLLESGYFADPLGVRTFDIQQNSPIARNVVIKAGRVLVPFTKGGFTWKVVVENTADIVLAVPSSAGSLWDTVIVKVDLTADPNITKSNIATVELVRFNTSNPTDNQIQTAIGAGYGFLRLGVVDALTGTTSIATAQITNSVAQVTLNKSIKLQESTFVINESQIVISNALHAGASLPSTPYSGQVFNHNGVFKWYNGTVWKIFPDSKFGGTGVDGAFSAGNVSGTVTASPGAYSQSGTISTAVNNSTNATGIDVTWVLSFTITRLQAGDTVNWALASSSGTARVISVSGTTISMTILTCSGGSNWGGGQSFSLTGNYGILVGTGTSFVTDFPAPYNLNGMILSGTEYNIYTVTNNTSLELGVTTTFSAIGSATAFSKVTYIDFGGASILYKNYTSFSLTGNAKLRYKNFSSSAGPILYAKVQGNLTLTSSQTNQIDISGISAAGNSIGIKAPTQGVGSVSGNSSNFLYGLPGLGTGINSFKAGIIPAFAGGKGGNGQSIITGGKGGGGIMFEVAGSFTGSGTATVAGQSAQGSGGSTGASWTSSGGGGFADGGGAFYNGGASSDYGGGGGGGFFGVLYNTLVSNTLSVTVSGGSGVNGGGSGGNGVSVIEQNERFI